ncbi:MAG: helix-turn-helix domain-containing protein [Lachnospirales bacterium]
MSSICSSRLFNLRHRSGLSQKEVAARLGISPQCCSHYENGRRVPDIFMLYRFAKFYHVSMAYLLGHPLSETYESPSSFLPSLNTLSSEQLSQVQQYLHFLVYQKQHPSPVPQLPSSRCFASRLKKYRKRLGLTQAAIARTLHVTPAAYSHYETGQRLPSPELFQRITDLFQISMETLLMTESDFPQTLPHHFAFLSSEEQQKVRLFIDFLRTQK